VSLSIAFIILIVDQVSKHFASACLSPITPVTIITSVFDLVLVKNQGAAFGLMSGVANPYRTIIFTLISLGAVFLLVYIYRTRPEGNKLVPVAIGLVSGGAVGNWIDRIRFGHVVDFFDFHIGVHHWPTFNVADSCISIGVTLLLIQMIREDPS